MVDDCPNCGRQLEERVRGACILEALGELLQERTGEGDEEIVEFVKTYDVDFLWEQLGPVIDQLEDDFLNEEGD